MLSKKYFDRESPSPIDLDNDEADLSSSMDQYGKVPFARHPEGFPVFLDPNKLEACDEYRSSDPYKVKVNIESDFQKRRLECTLAMIIEGIKEIQGVPKILDLGCGQGHITYKIREALAEAEVSGLDYSISAIEYANHLFPNIDFAVGDAYDCPYKESYFDIVVCNNLWEHVPDPLFLLSRITNILKPHGFLILSTPSRYRLGNIVRILMGKPVTFMSQHHVTEYSVGQVLEQLGYGGFQVTKFFSKPIKKASLLKTVVTGIFSTLLSVTRTHHQLESTVFYLAKRTEEKTSHA